MAERRTQHSECSRNHQGAQGRRGSSFLAALLILGGGMLCSRSIASPSGLNNIPTTDTAAVKTFVLQGWGGFGNGQGPDWWTGFKFGLVEGLELGADWDADGDPARHVQFQGKYAINLNDAGTRVAAGVANVSDDRDRNGDCFPYAVITQDFNGLFRVHLGYDFQEDNEGAFGGIDHTFDLMDRDVMLCGDAIQVNDGDDWLLAPGIKFGLAPRAAEGQTSSGLNKLLEHFVFESWVTFPTQDDAEEVFVAKLNLVLNF
ncbi:MAG: hypothetical protein RBS72_00145 [Sedimentisphaerales bacterium]|nr:hypothetical protein [Sedimentisphaerales bacterium]NLZ03698.1 hypothetical protein [Phycisphaerae bacterium]HNY76984.1 hypothetical protein [Sedimentisphaerales bacterium]HOC64707.1 hypothetical protein [Sedimentisphaerales bacterium]HOH62758.1 hypothetical protein [Sedimentisphaerales bacterium]